MKKKSRELSITSAVLFGIISSIAISILLLLVVAMLVDNGRLEISGGKYAVILIHVLSAFVGCVVSGKIAGEKWGAVCGASGGGYLLLFIIVSMLFFDGLNGQLLSSIIAVAIGCGAGMLLCARKKSPKRKSAFRRVR